MQRKKPYVAPFIRRVMEGASEEEILEASENLRAYLDIAFAAFLRQRHALESRDSPTSDTHGRFAQGDQPPRI